jgi:acyl dehydratase
VTLRQEIKNQHGETVAALDKRTLHARRPAN